MKPSLKVTTSRIRLREVEVHYLEFAFQRRWVVLYPKPVEQCVKIVLRYVVVASEHTQEYALAETSGTD